MEEKGSKSETHKENTQVLTEGKKVKVKFYDTIVLELNAGKVTFRRNDKYRTQITRRIIKHYCFLLIKKKLVIKKWKSDTPKFILEGELKLMHNNKVSFSV